MARRCDWEKKPTLGEFPLMPSTPELIQRNLSTLRYTLRKMGDAATETARNLWKGEAELLIKEHNRLVNLNKTILRRVR